jgi:hypothetical protein
MTAPTTGFPIIVRAFQPDTGICLSSRPRSSLPCKRMAKEAWQSPPVPSPMGRGTRVRGDALSRWHDLASRITHTPSPPPSPHGRGSVLRAWKRPRSDCRARHGLSQTSPWISGQGEWVSSPDNARHRHTDSAYPLTRRFAPPSPRGDLCEPPATPTDIFPDGRKPSRDPLAFPQASQGVLGRMGPGSSMLQPPSGGPRRRPKLWMNLSSNGLFAEASHGRGQSVVRPACVSAAGFGAGRVQPTRRKP